MKSLLLIVAMPLLLTACATAPSVPPVSRVECPKLPIIEMVEPGVLEASFTDQMLNFLSGSLSAPTPSDYSLPPAKLPTNQP